MASWLMALVGNSRAVASLVAAAVPWRHPGRIAALWPTPKARLSGSSRSAATTAEGLASPHIVVAGDSACGNSRVRRLPPCQSAQLACQSPSPLAFGRAVLVAGLVGHPGQR